MYSSPRTLTYSSRHPDELYKNGIQRSSFLPCIDLLKEHFEVTDLDSGTGMYYTVPHDKFPLLPRIPQSNSALTPLAVLQITVAYPERCPTFTTTL